MRQLLCILMLFILLIQKSVAQSLFTDSVVLLEVKIKAEKDVASPSENQMILDSAVLSNTTTGNLAEIISENTGIFVKSYGQSSLTSVSFRGSGASHTGFYWNGFSLNSAMNGQIDLSLLPAAFYDEVIVDFGSSSMQYGAGGLGGSIQMLSSPNFTNKLTTAVHQSVGSFNQYGTFAKLMIGNTNIQSSTKIYRQSTLNNFEYRNLGKEGFPLEEQTNADFEQYGIQQGIYFKPKENQLLKLDAWYMNTDRNIPSIMTVNNRKESQKDESIRLVTSFKNYYEKSALELASNYQHERLDYNNEMMQEYSVTTVSSWKNLAKMDYFPSANLNFKATAHLDVENLESEIYSLKKDRVRQAIYLSGTYCYKRYTVELFGREEYITEKDIYFIPGLALAKKLGKKKSWMVRTSVANNMKYPTLNDLYWTPGGNPNLNPETSTNYEIGISSNDVIQKHQAKAGFSLNFFHYNIQNYIQWRPTSFGYWRAENLKEIQSKGVEVNADLKKEWANSTITWNASYSYTSSISTKALQIDDASVGKQLLYVPHHILNTNMVYTIHDYWIKPSIHYTGLRYTTSDNSDFLPAFALFHLKFGKKMQIANNSWSVEFAVNNLFNHSYQAILWRPMPGRSYMATIKYQFKK